MVRILFILFMAWMVILNSMVYSVICVNFQLNRSFISEMFCENKDMPMSECKGSCYLTKQLDQASQESDTDWMSFRADFNLFILFNYSLLFPKNIYVDSIEHVGFLNIKIYQTDLSVLERPPITV